jgi:protein-tyrosine phosphatase
MNLTTDRVELPGVTPADPPSELLPGRLWQGGCPVDYGWARRTGIDVILDISDADTYPPEGAVDGLAYLKCPLVDGAVPDPALTLRLADLVAALVREGRRALVHCTFGRNRSGLMATLIVRAVERVDGAAALRRVQQTRDGAVNNTEFARWLRSLPAPD